MTQPTQQSAILELRRCELGKTPNRPRDVWENALKFDDPKLVLVCFTSFTSIRRRQVINTGERVIKALTLLVVGRIQRRNNEMARVLRFPVLKAARITPQ